MPPVCRECRWFRPFRPLSQVVLRDLGADEPQLVEQLLKVMQDERERQDAEMKLKVELLRLAGSRLASSPDEDVRGEAQRWVVRPTMTDHCGRWEENGVYLLHELKNLSSDCGDFKPRDPTPKACDTCRHRCTGGGPVRDAEQYAVLGQLARNAAALGQPGGLDQLDEYRRFVAATKTLEAAQACYAGKIALARPDYLPTCGHPEAVDYSPCAVRNQYDACQQWEAAPVPPPAANGLLMRPGRNPATN